MPKPLTYDLPGLFHTRWFWFEKPKDISGVDEVVYFSYEKLAAEGFKRKKGMTTVIDLSHTEEDLYMQMRKKFVRKQISRGESRGIVVRNGTYEEFLPLYKSFRKNKNIGFSRIAEAAEVGEIFIAEHEGKIVAAGLFLSDGRHVRAHALISKRLSSKEMREIIGYANRILLWKAIRFYKSIGCKMMDLGGINVQSKKREDKSLAEFKEAFGGQRTECFYYRKVYAPLLKVLYTVRTYIPI